jgi:branched-chain amino acid transport system substrate-binding protein
MTIKIKGKTIFVALFALFAASLPLMASGGGEKAADKQPIYFGVSGPLTGDWAQYGAQWKKGFDLALEQINGTGGTSGRPLAYVFEDSQSDPKQSVTVAQKFVSDSRIVAELGDFSSTASMAASPIYQRAGLVQLGFTNSHPDFTKGGDYMWSNSTTQKDDAPNLAQYAVKEIGLKKLAVFYLNTDWGKATTDLFSQTVQDLGGSVVDKEAYLPSEKDFHASVTKVSAANPDGIVLVSYNSDGALIAQQLRAQGIRTPIIADAAVFSPEFLALGGDAVEGVYTSSEFFPGDPRPEVQRFVTAYKAKYNEDPDLFAAIAYDAIGILAAAIREGGATRQGIHDGLGKIHDIPSVIYGKLTFDADRRVAHPQQTRIIVRNGQFAAWSGGN